MPFFPGNPENTGYLVPDSKKKMIPVPGYLHRTESQFFVAPHLLQIGDPFTIAMLWFWLQLLFENMAGRPFLPHFLQVIFPVIMVMS
jgi:hypothetical protein